MAYLIDDVLPAVAVSSIAQAFSELDGPEEWNCVDLSLVAKDINEERKRWSPIAQKLTWRPNMARAAVLPRYMARPQWPMVTLSSEKPWSGKAATSPAAQTPGKVVAMEESTGMKPLASTSRPGTLVAMPEAGVTPTPITASSAVRSLSLLECSG